MTKFYTDKFCPVCKSPAKKYILTCGNAECRRKQTESTNTSKYGHPCSVHGSGPKKKKVKTLLKRYGVDNVSNIPEVKEKKKLTCEKNFGVSWPMQSEVVRHKSQQTCLGKYEVDNVSKSKEIIGKIKNSLNRVQSNGKTVRENASQKAKRTIFERYGDFYFSTNDFKEKYKQTMLERYGVDNFWKSQQFKDEMISRGIQHDPNTRNVLDSYYAKVHSATSKNFKKYFDELCSVYLRGKDYHLDHKFSIIEGYRQGMSPEVIGSIVNLELISASENLKKRERCSITKEKLLELYEQERTVNV